MSLFKWQLYAAQGMRNKWVNMLGSEGGEDEEDQDSLKVMFPFACLNDFLKKWNNQRYDCLCAPQFV